MKKIDSVIEGGSKRFDSVKNGMKKIKDADYIFIHDGVRPFVDKKLIKKLFLAAKKYGVAVPVAPLKQTLKNIRGNSFIKNTPDRKCFYEAQTPQVFRKNILFKAYKKKPKKHITDDSSLVESFCKRIKAVQGDYNNIKITTREDLELAKILLRKNK